jgi:hypothetical protein
VSIDANTAASLAIAVAAGSEIIALSPLKSNSWVQLIFQLLRVAFPKR